MRSNFVVVDYKIVFTNGVVVEDVESVFYDEECTYDEIIKTIKKIREIISKGYAHGYDQGQINLGSLVFNPTQTVFVRLRIHVTNVNCYQL